MSGSSKVSPADIVLISMPYAPLVSPSIGLSILKSLVEEKHPTEVVYYGLYFAERFGLKIYNWISSGRPSTLAMLGEWIFSAALFEDEEHDVDRYLQLLEEFHGKPLPEKTIQSFLTLRKEAPGFIDDCVDKVIARNPKIVGLTSVFQQQVASLAFAKRLKEKAPLITTVMGGANCEGPMGREMARQFPFVDAKVFPDLVERIFAGESLDGLEGVYRPGVESETLNAPRVAKMDEIPMPNYDDFLSHWESSPARHKYQGSLLFETSRGCWWGEKSHCTFCGLNGSGMTFRSKSPERAMEELLELTKGRSKYSVQVVDNILDMRYFKTFLPALAERPEKRSDLFYEVKANLKRDQIRMLRAAGVTKIQPGIESLSDDVLDRMGKGVSALQNVQLLKWCEEYGVTPMWNIIYGFPGELAHDYQAVADMVPALVHLEPPGGCHQIRLDRFSPNFERGHEIGFRDIRPADSYFHMYPGLPEESVFELAYYFGYDYEDDRTPYNYAQPLRKMTDYWKAAHKKSSLHAVASDERLTIWDTRPTAKIGMTFIEGLQRSLYEACDSTMTSAKLSRVAERLTGKTWSEESVDDFLAPLVESAYLLKLDDKYLSLAVSKSMMRVQTAKAA